MELNTVSVDTYSDCFTKHLERCKMCVVVKGDYVDRR